MSTNPKKLSSNVQIATTITTYYTVPTSTTTVIKQYTLHNTSSSRVQVTIHIVNSGGTAGNSTQLFKRYIAPLSSLTVNDLINATMTAGDNIQCIADTASSVTMHISGNEVT